MVTVTNANHPNPFVRVHERIVMMSRHQVKQLSVPITIYAILSSYDKTIEAALAALPYLLGKRVDRIE